MTLVRPFRPEDAAAFANLNLRWIEELFEVEDSDRQQLEDPQHHIIDKGGAIAIAVDDDGDIVGCGALITPHHDPQDSKVWLEIVKMATSPKAQGQGVGGAVMQFLIDAAREQGGDAIWLETNSALAPAIRLYERHGFRALGPDELWPTPYSRCNYQLVREL